MQALSPAGGAGPGQGTGPGTHHGKAQALSPAALLALEVVATELGLVAAEVAAPAVDPAHAGLAHPAPPPPPPAPRALPQRCPSVPPARAGEAASSGTRQGIKHLPSPWAEGILPPGRLGPAASHRAVTSAPLEGLALPASYGLGGGGKEYLCTRKGFGPHCHRGVKVMFTQEGLAPMPHEVATSYNTLELGLSCSVLAGWGRGPLFQGGLWPKYLPQDCNTLHG